LNRYIAVFVLLFVIVICGNIAYAEYQLPEDRAVDVVETDRSIEIYARMTMIGEFSDDFFPHDKFTYSMAFVQGVCQKWSGEYNGKQVTFHAIQTEEATPAKKIKVYFNKAQTAFERCCADKDTMSIWMYIDDWSMNIYRRYSYDGFMQVAAHEMGHILGLGDVYNDGDEFIRNNTDSIMRSWSNKQASKIDYYMLLSHRTWLNDGYYQYSNDKKIFALIERND